MQQNCSDIALVTQNAPITASTHGGRAKCLQRLVRLDLPVPRTVVLSFDMVHKIAANQVSSITEILDHFEANDLLCVRPSSESPDWGGPLSLIHI